MERLASYTKSISSLPKGTAYTRAAVALAHAGNQSIKALKMAQWRTGRVVDEDGREKAVLLQDRDEFYGIWRDSPQVVEVVRSAIDPLSTSNSSALVRQAEAEFAESLAPTTIIGKISGFRKAPFNIKLVSSNARPGVAWRGEGGSTSIVAGSFSTETALAPLAISGTAVFSNELLESSDPAVDTVMKGELSRAIQAYSDRSFIDPSEGGLSGIQPQSITFGATQLNATGGGVLSLANVDTDLARMLNALIDGGVPLIAPYWIMSPSTATSLSLLRGTGGAAAFPLIGPRGGSLLNIGVVTSGSCIKHGSPGEDFFVLMDSSEILLAEDVSIRLDVAKQTSIEMESTPSDGPTTVVSMWQFGLAAVRAEKRCNWKRRRDAAVVTLMGINW